MTILTQAVNQEAKVALEEATLIHTVLVERLEALQAALEEAIPTHTALVERLAVLPADMEVMIPTPQATRATPREDMGAATMIPTAQQAIPKANQVTALPASCWRRLVAS